MAGDPIDQERAGIDLSMLIYLIYLLELVDLSPYSNTIYIYILPVFVGLSDYLEIYQSVYHFPCY